MKDATSFGFSRFWDIYLPLGMSSIPAGCFKLMGMAAAGLDQPINVGWDKRANASAGPPLNVRGLASRIGCESDCRLEFLIGA